ncbi:MAG TPA: 5-methyltetrahydropteroyltriglutamate--homocysteine S-methyltransferase [Trebonia sp.]|jgi:5-methyltetrahydropteroyltriglutamate--homocysteine methyltransferase|nr:5-methyltetrahydropteroyltriglutamate--homocysteine S-methyltransferase [Trebonia sp.]
MSPRTSPPFRADHVGSLLRPARLHAARADRAAGKISAGELRAVEDDAIRDAVTLQREAGLQSVTDGEFRRATWHMDFVFQIGGISQVPGSLQSTFHNEQGDISFSTPGALRVTRPLSMDKTIFGDHFAFLQEAAAGQRSRQGDPLVPKLTIPAPSMVHYRSGIRAVVDEAVYPDVEQFWADLAAAYNEEVHRLAGQGCRYLQLDDTSLAYVNDPAQRAYIAERGEDAENIHLRYISLTNAAVAGRPAGMAVTTHLCRGNFQSSWVASGGYDFVAESLFSELDVDGFFLEYDDDRSGGFEPLRFVPNGKQVVLGLVTTKRPQLESRDDLKRRIDEAAKYLPLDQLCLSGQCGFASTEQGNALTADEQKAKLELIVSVADEVWGG